MRKRILELDGLRAVAIIAVFCRHALGVRFLWIGVDVFFILSGFLITGILLDLRHKDLRHKDLGKYFSHFYERRVRRILPPYVLLLIVCSLVFGAAWANHWYMYLGLTNYTHIFPGKEYMPFNPLWSLGVEEQFYVVWPFAIYFLKEKHLPYVLIGVIAAAAVMRAIATPYDTHHWFIYRSTPFRMDDMALGSLLTFVWRKRPQLIQRYGYMTLILPLLTPPVMLVLNKVGGFSTMDGTLEGNVITYWIATLAALGMFLWALGGRYTWLLTNGPMRFLGKISYSFYLIHMSMILLSERFLKQPWKVAAVAFTASVIYATLSWYLIENPILHMGSKKVAQRELEAASTHTAV